MRWGIKIGKPHLPRWMHLPDKPYPGAIGRWWGAPTTYASYQEAADQCEALNRENIYWSYYVEEYL